MRKLLSFLYIYLLKLISGQIKSYNRSILTFHFFFFLLTFQITHLKLKNGMRQNLLKAEVNKVNKYSFTHEVNESFWLT